MRVIHLFRWKLNDIDVEAIHNQGFDAIQINPIQPTKDDTSDAWWMYYQPIAFEIGNNLGTKEDLIDLCRRARDYNIKIIADVVLNHMASLDTGEIFPHQKVDKKLTDSPNYWRSFKKISDFDDRWESTNYSIGLPSLNLSNPYIQDLALGFLNELISCGVGGFRFDAAKHISLPEDDGNTFWKRVSEELIRKDLFNYGEVLFADKDLIDTYCKYFNVLTAGCGSDKNKMVVFCDNHDFDKEFKYTANITDEMVMNEYDILCNNYPNTVFYAREFNSTWENERVRLSNNKAGK